MKSNNLKSWSHSHRGRFSGQDDAPTIVLLDLLIYKPPEEWTELRGQLTKHGFDAIIARENSGGRSRTTQPIGLRHWNPWMNLPSSAGGRVDRPVTFEASEALSVGVCCTSAERFSRQQTIVQAMRPNEKARTKVLADHMVAPCKTAPGRFWGFGVGGWYSEGTRS